VGLGLESPFDVRPGPGEVRRAGFGLLVAFGAPPPYPKEQFQYRVRPLGLRALTEHSDERNGGDEAEIRESRNANAAEAGNEKIRHREKLRVKHHVSELALAPRGHAPVGRDRSAWKCGGRLLPRTATGRLPLDLIHGGNRRVERDNRPPIARQETG